MSPLRKYHAMLASLIILALFVVHVSGQEKMTQGENEGSFQVHEEAFEVTPVSMSNESDTITIQIPVPTHSLPITARDDQEQVLVVDGQLDNFLYLPAISNNVYYVFDDFSNPTSGFPVVDTSTNIYQYINGEYQILNKTNGYLGAVTVGHKLEEFEFEVSMRRVGGARGFYGIVFWLDNTWSEYYLLMLSPDNGEYYYYQYKSSSGFTLLSYTLNYQYINLGSAVNRVGMKQYWASDMGVGIFLEASFTINGYSANFNTVPPQGAYRVGFFAAPIDANHEVRFDKYLFKNYCVLYPGCSN